jgi:hypothetical protein
MVRPLFKKHQKELLAFSNTQYGRGFISLFGGKELKDNYPIVKVTPDGIHQQLDKNLYRAVFYPRSPYIKHFGEVLTMVDIAKDSGYDSDRKDLVIPHYLGETRLLRNELPQICLLTSPATFNPDANVESTSVDGVAYRNGVDEAFSTIRAGDGTGNQSSTAAGDGAIIISSTTSSQYADLRRSIFLFDTSDLTTDATISAATFSTYINAVVNGLGGGGAVSLVESTPTSSTDIANADFGQVGTTLQATAKTLDSMTTSQYNDWTLNAAGLTSISKTSITKFGQRDEGDRANSAPSWVSVERHGHELNFADSASNKPKLVVTYTLPSGFLAFL